MTEFERHWWKFIPLQSKSQNMYR